MKVAIINFSGNVGKTSLARSLFMPRMNNPKVISVESTNSDGQEDSLLNGKRFINIIREVGLNDDVIVDIGSSEVKDFIYAMEQQKGSQDEFDMFVVPTVAKTKQIADTLKTIAYLTGLKIKKENIKVIFNIIDNDTSIDEAFAPILKYHADNKSFTIVSRHISDNELHPLLFKNKITIDSVLADKTNYREIIKNSKITSEREAAMDMIAFRRLAEGVNDELNSVFADLIKA